jgi:putative acetyltransferase
MLLKLFAGESRLHATLESAKRFTHSGTIVIPKPAPTSRRMVGHCGPSCTTRGWKPCASQILNVRVIRASQPGDELAFRTLNENWIAAYFSIEEKDREILHHPVESILEAGGQIFFAVRGEQRIGSCALVPMEDGSFEVSKMTVADQERGRGTGRKILKAVIDYARERGIRRLYLEIDSKLTTAIHLYEALGFRHIPEKNKTPSPYARANVFMELSL